MFFTFTVGYPETCNKHNIGFSYLNLSYGIDEDPQIYRGISSFLMSNCCLNEIKYQCHVHDFTSCEGSKPFFLFVLIKLWLYSKGSAVVLPV